MSISWKPPQKRNSVILQYKIEITGKAKYKDALGKTKSAELTPVIDYVDYQNRVFRKNQLAPNTNYTIKVSCQSRQRFYGNEAVANCTMPVTVPERENLNVRSWYKIESQGRQLLKTYTPRLSERNGSICCYRIFLVKLGPQQTLADLPSPEEIPVYPYQYVYNSQSSSAYLAEMFDSDKWPAEVFLGDDETFNASLACQQCTGLKQKTAPTLVNIQPEVSS